MSNLPEFLSQETLEHNLEFNINVEPKTILRGKQRLPPNHYSDLPIKWTRKLSDELKGKFRGKSLQDLEFNSISDNTLRLELSIFKETLLWYHKNIKERFMEPEDIFWSCIDQGPAFADYLSDTLKYSIRKTLGMRLEDSIRDYPVLQDRIDYIFDPKCLIEWEATPTDDYLWLFKEPKENLDNDLIDQILSSCPVVNNLDEPDVIDWLKLFRKSKIFDSKKLKSVPAFKDTIGNPKWKTPLSLKFKRTTVHKYPDERRDILVCDHDTLKIILEASFYLKQIQDQFKEYKKDRSDVLTRLKRHKDKYYYLMTDLKKSGLSISRKLVKEMLLHFYNTYHKECFLTLFKGFDNYWLYDGQNWKFTTEGKGLGLLDELVCIGCMLLFRYAVGNNNFPPGTKGWFFNDDQLIMVPRDSYWSLEGLLDGWNQLVQSIGYTVHGEKPYISKYAQYLEIYSPRCPINMEKSLRQYHIMISCVRYPAYEAKSQFATNYSRWWGLKPEDYNNALDFISQHQCEFTDAEYYYPQPIGGWINFKRKVVGIDTTFQEVLANWNSIDRRYINILVNQPNIKVLSRWYKKYIKKISSVLQMHTVDDDCMFSLKTRIDQLVENVKLPTKYEFKYKKIVFEQMYAARQKAFKQKVMNSKNEFLEFIKSKTWNNYAIPVEFAVCDGNPPYQSYPLRNDYTPCEDVVRLYNQYIGEFGIRKPKSGDLTSLYKVLIDSQESRYKGCDYTNCIRANLIKKLMRFGTNTRLLIDNFMLICHKNDIIPSDIMVEPVKSDWLEPINCCITNSTTIVCSSGAIWEIDTDLIPDWVNVIQNRIDLSQVTIDSIKASLGRKYNHHPNEFWDILLLRIQEINESYLKSKETTTIPKGFTNEIQENTPGLEKKQDQEKSEVDIDYAYFNLQIQSAFAQMGTLIGTGRVIQTHEDFNRYVTGDCEMADLDGDLSDMFDNG
jgi:hypothetical protein